MKNRDPIYELSFALLGLLLICTVTLFPFEFKPLDPPSDTSFVGSISRLSWHLSPVDWLLNILLFIPFSFGLAGLLGYLSLPTTIRRWLVLGICFILTLTVEYLQLTLPRLPSYSDLLTNAIGAVVGLIIYEKWGRGLFASISRFAEKVAHLGFRRLIIVSFLCYVVLMVGLFLNSRRRTSLSYWDDSFHLVLGNEFTANRPWRGIIHELRVAERDLSRQEVERLLAGGNPDSGNYAQHFDVYHFRGTEGHIKSNGILPDLYWRGRTENPASDPGVHLSSNHWLESDQPASRLIHTLKASNRFTLQSVVTSLDTTLTGPARIVSISMNPFKRNFTIGQDGKDLVVRLRTHFTRENGRRPELIVPDVFTGSNTLNLVVTYNGATLNVYINNYSQRYKLELQYPAALCVGGLSFDKRDMHGYKMVCHGVVIIPVACFGLLIFRHLMIGPRRK